MLNRILVIEDALDFQRIIDKTLSFKYELDTVGTLSEARNKIKSNSYALILVDIHLPDGDGFDLCRELQAREETSGTPFIFLTGRNSLTDMLIGFSIGADDYITKPFDPTELMIRVDHRITKSAHHRNLTENIQRGPLRLDLNSMGAYIEQNSQEVFIDLTRTEFKLLLKLAQNLHRVLSREQLIDGVWGRGFNVEDRSVDKHISSLRRKMSPFSDLIRTVAGVGYEFQV